MDRPEGTVDRRSPNSHRDLQTRPALLPRRLPDQPELGQKWVEPDIGRVDTSTVRRSAGGDVHDVAVACGEAQDDRPATPQKQWRMWPLDRPRVKVEIAYLIVLPVVGEGVRTPRAAEHVNCLTHASEADLRRVECNPCLVIVRTHPPAAEAKFEPAAGK